LCQRRGVTGEHGPLVEQPGLPDSLVHVADRVQCQVWPASTPAWPARALRPT
jgi:hypothetical protein